MIPQTINITELRQNLPSFLDRVETGESFLVTVRGKVVARLQPEAEPAEAAYERLLSYRQGSWIGDVITPLDEEWTGDSDHL
jgi:prevent-host-death family protein